MSAKSAPQEVFLSYAPEDEPLCLKLEKHLSLLKQKGLITVWHKGRIRVGTDRNKELYEHLSVASVIVLLLSSDFAASEACISVEMSLAMERHKAGETSVIPVLLRPTDDWRSTPIGSLQMLPSNGVPVINWSSQDDAFADVARGIRSVLQDGTLPPTVIAPLFLPSAWNIPYPRNPVFTGREEILARIQNQLQAGQAAALSQAQAISGLGGIGKTQIAIEFAYRHARDYQAVFWVLSDTRESLVSGYITIAELLNLPQKHEQDQVLVIKAVKSWLQTHGSWLLILDNADDLAMVRELIPATFGGHLLLTTRAQAMGRLAHRVEVETMSLDVGALFLLRRGGLVAEHISLDTASSEDVAAARSITEELGGLPLALDQAGAYIEETGCCLEDYQRLYRVRRSDLLKERGGLVEDHREPVATTWSISFKNVEERNPAAADLLRICAFLHPDAIPEEIVTKGAEHLGSALQEATRNPLLWNKAISALGAYSLIRRDGERKTLSIHRLVQAVLKDAMGGQARRQWAERVVQAVNEAFPDVEFTTWPQCERCLPHALVCADLVQQEQIILPEAARVLRQAGLYLTDRASYSKAQPLLERAYQISQRGRGLEHLDTARDAITLAYLYEVQGKYRDAEPLYERALALREQLLGADHPDTASSLNLLALLYGNQGKYRNAETLMKRALAIQEQQLGADHPDTASSLNNLAELYNDQEKYSQAEPLYERALSINERHLGATHPYTATCLNNLALLYDHLGKHSRAEPLYRRGLAIYEQTLGQDHPYTQTVRKNYMRLLETMKRDSSKEHG